MNYSDLKINIHPQDEFLATKSGQNNIIINYDGPRNVALDLGAHVGVRSLWMATEESIGKIYAVECVPQNFVMLCENVVNNDLQEKIIPMLLAVGNSNGVETVKHVDGNYGQFSLFFATHGSKELSYPVYTISFSELIEYIPENIDIIKFDIEGAEYPIFANPQIKESLKK